MTQTTTTTTTQSTHTSSNATQENLHLARGEKEFIHDEKTLQKQETQLQQRGGEHRRFRTFPKREKEEKTHAPQERVPEQEKRKETEKQEQKYNKQQEQQENRTKQKKEILKKGLKEQAAIQHDMQDMAMGQMYKIQGANIDYDEGRRMAENHIRDASELASESLQNDGMNGDMNKIEQAMSEFLQKGTPRAADIQQMARDMEPEVVAMAYTNVAKNAEHRDLIRLTILDEKLDFEQPKYERAFDRIRARDAEADRVLDKLDMQMGRERE